MTDVVVVPLNTESSVVFGCEWLLIDVATFPAKRWVILRAQTPTSGAYSHWRQILEIKCPTRRHQDVRNVVTTSSWRHSIFANPWNRDKMNESIANLTIYYRSSYIMEQTFLRPLMYEVLKWPGFWNHNNNNLDRFVWQISDLRRSLFRVSFGSQVPGL